MSSYHGFARRDFLWRLGGGLGGIAMAHLLGNQGLLASAGTEPVFLAGTPRPPKVRRVVQLFMNGGASQMDTFDYKPELEKRHGQRVDVGLKATATGTPGPLMKSPFRWKQHGESGRWVTDVFPRISGSVDDLAFLMAMAS